MAKTIVKTKDEDTEANMSEILTDSVYINPLTDFGFKRLFYNKELLISFLNDVVGTDIKDIVYRPTEGMGCFTKNGRPSLICCARIKMTSLWLLKCNWGVKRISGTGSCFMALISYANRRHAGNIGTST